ncbi:MAG: FHA domain-containing protein [Microthrixaceae bacterium]|nr:FHA domain-containing protein [Microthrixaceae bacterium]MCO5311452.1 FHA domain-containing protein [Microthrixaceae bacterium]
MPDQLLTIFRLCFLVLLYLFFFRVLRAIWTEVNSVPAPFDGPAPKLSRKARKAIRSAPGDGAGAPPAPITTSPPPEPTVSPTTSRRLGTPNALRVIDPPHLAGVDYPLADNLIFGRGGSAAVVFDDAFMSTLHLRITATGRRWFAEDLGSTNGTYINRVRVTGIVELSLGDQIQMGNVVLEVV